MRTRYAASPKPASKDRASETTILGSTPAMHGCPSMGHSRSRHGEQSTGWRTIRADGAAGPVASALVAPKTATVGTPNAAATCIEPESLVRKSRHVEASSKNSGRLVWPAKQMDRFPALAATSAANGSSASDPNTAMPVPSSSARSAAALAKRSAGQRLAEPNAAPGLTPIHGPGDSPRPYHRDAPLRRNASIRSKRAAVSAGTRSIRRALRSNSK